MKKPKKPMTIEDWAKRKYTGVGLGIGTVLAAGLGIGLGTALSSVAMVTVGAVAGLSIGVAIGDALDKRAKAKEGSKLVPGSSTTTRES